MKNNNSEGVVVRTVIAASAVVMLLFSSSMTLAGPITYNFEGLISFVSLGASQVGTAVSGYVTVSDLLTPTTTSPGYEEYVAVNDAENSGHIAEIAFFLELAGGQTFMAQLDCTLPSSCISNDSFVLSASRNDSPSSGINLTATDIDQIVEDNHPIYGTYYSSSYAQLTTNFLGSLAGPTLDGSVRTALNVPFDSSALIYTYGELFFSNDTNTNEYDRFYFEITSFSVQEQEVPTPGTLAMMSIGLAGIGWKRRKQK